jgi:hypothetical protein
VAMAAVISVEALPSRGCGGVVAGWVISLGSVALLMPDTAEYRHRLGRQALKFGQHQRQLWGIMGDVEVKDCDDFGEALPSRDARRLLGGG